jgi:hypothetical protein
MNWDDENTVDELPARPRGPGLSDADLELLTLAARAIGAIRVEVVEGEQWVNLHFADALTIYSWNSLVHSDDAFELLVRLSMREGGAAMLLNSRFGQTGFVSVHTDEHHIAPQEYMVDSPSAATRLAVTRAAAEIGKSMG